MLRRNVIRISIVKKSSRNPQNLKMTKIVLYVIVFDQIRIQISQAHQNDIQNLSFMRDINEVAKIMDRNGLKIANSWSCAFHFESEFRYMQNRAWI